jgi:hypothetical protein
MTLKAFITFSFFIETRANVEQADYACRGNFSSTWTFLDSKNSQSQICVSRIRKLTRVGT